MSDLVDFLRARLDEQAAKAHASTEWFGPWELENDHAFDPADAEFIAYQTARHTLREVEAKRQIVNMYERHVHDYYRAWTSALPPYRTIQHLASIYADHPDYREEWRPR